MHCLHRNADFFKPEERAALINKYVPVALNSLYRLYTAGGDDDDEGGDEENRGKLQEMKIKMKYKQEAAVIAEEDEDSSSEEEAIEEVDIDAVELEVGDNP